MTTYPKKFIKLSLSLFLLSLPVVGWMQRWNLYDYWRLRGYQPPSAIAQLASDTTMKDNTRRTFYAYHPELNDKEVFHLNCKTTERTIVLGCYVTGRGIYLFNVTDERLNGVLQVTAAHETLHAAYDRLSSADKKRIKILIDDAYAKLNDERIKSTIEDYRKNGADITNELHSILATEVRDLSPELEEYYKRYFDNRLKIVSYSDNYEQAFSERKNKIASYDQRLAELKQQIENEEAALSRSEKSLEAERARLDALLAARRYDEYNAGVGNFNAQVSAYNRQVGRIRNLIDQFNRLVAERNALATEENELVKAIDSRPDIISH